MVQLFPIAPCSSSSHPNRFILSRSIPSRSIPSRFVPVRAVPPGGAARHNSATCRSRRAPPGTGESPTHSGCRDPGTLRVWGTLTPPGCRDPATLRIWGTRTSSRLPGPRGSSKSRVPDPSRLEGPWGLPRAGDADHIPMKGSRVGTNRDRRGCWASSGCWASAGEAWRSRGRYGGR